jgi:hypothetical protein
MRVPSPATPLLLASCLAATTGAAGTVAAQDQSAPLEMACPAEAGRHCGIGLVEDGPGGRLLVLRADGPGWGGRRVALAASDGEAYALQGYAGSVLVFEYEGPSGPPDGAADRLDGVTLLYVIARSRPRGRGAPGRNFVRPCRVASVGARRVGGGTAMARSRTGGLALGAMLGLAALAGCETSDRDRDGGRSEGRGDTLGGILGGVLGGDGRSQRVGYRCDDDRRFTASFDRGGRNVTVDAGGRTYELRATGNRGEYRGEDGDVRLEVDRSRAELRIKDESDYQNCEER